MERMFAGLRKVNISAQEKITPKSPNWETVGYGLSTQLALSVMPECYTSPKTGRIYFTHVDGSENDLPLDIVFLSRKKQALLINPKYEYRVDGVKKFRMTTHANMQYLIFDAETEQGKESVAISRKGEVTIVKGEWVLQTQISTHSEQYDYLIQREKNRESYRWEDPSLCKKKRPERYKKKNSRRSKNRN